MRNPLPTFRSVLGIASLSVVLAACGEQPTHLLGGGSQGGSSGQGGPGGSSATGTPDGGSSSSDGGGPSGTGGDGNPEPQPASFEISVDDAAPSIELRDSVDITVTVTPNGYVGSVPLDVTGLPGDVGGSLANASVTLDGTDAETVTLTLSSQSSTVTGDYPFTIHGTVESGDKSTSATLTVEPVITIIVPANLQGYSSNPPDTTAFGDYPTLITAPANMGPEHPITVKFYNADSVPHEIHADDAASGFPHSNALFDPNTFDPTERNVIAPGTYDYYPHDIGPTILGEITIQ